MKTFFTITWCLFATILFAQNKHADSLLDVSSKKFNIINYKESLHNAELALLHSKKVKYNTGIIKSQIFIAKVLYELGSFNEALVYINNAESIPTTELKLNIEIARMKGRIFGAMKLYDVSKKEFRKQIKLSKDLPLERDKTLSLIWGNENLMTIYQSQNKKDSIWYHLHQQLKLLNHLNPKEEPYIYYNIFLHTANQHIVDNNIKESKNYLNKVNRLISDYQLDFLYPFYLAKSDYYMKQMDYNNAEIYLIKALDNAKSLEVKNIEMDIYESLGALYSKNIQNPDKALHYTSLYNNLKKELEIKNDKLNENTLNYFLKNNNKQHLISKEVVLLIILIILTIIGFVFYKIYNIKKNNESIIPSTIESQQIVNDQKFRHLIELVKNNNPEFVVLFKELYPDFTDTLLKICPEIRTSEFSFLAMCYLNLSTKDIAEYTFVTIRAVQIRKNRLRKKYNIPSNIDFNTGVRNLSIPS